MIDEGFEGEQFDEDEERENYSDEDEVKFNDDYPDHYTNASKVQNDQHKKGL